MEKEMKERFEDWDLLKENEKEQIIYYLNQFVYPNGNKIINNKGIEYFSAMQLLNDIIGTNEIEEE